MQSNLSEKWLNWQNNNQHKMAQLLWKVVGEKIDKPP
jgi:hypothetical protein